MGISILVETSLRLSTSSDNALATYLSGTVEIYKTSII
jgi:hypothetical protein